MQTQEPNFKAQYAMRQAQIRLRLMAGVTDDDLEAIVKQLVKDAKAGDKAAAKIILERLLGKPEQAVTITPGQDADPLRDAQTLRQLLGLNRN